MKIRIILFNLFFASCFSAVRELQHAYVMPDRNTLYQRFVTFKNHETTNSQDLLTAYISKNSARASVYLVDNSKVLTYLADRTLVAAGIINAIHFGIADLQYMHTAEGRTYSLVILHNLINLIEHLLPEYPEVIVEIQEQLRIDKLRQEFPGKYTKKGVLKPEKSCPQTFMSKIRKCWRRGY